MKPALLKNCKFSLLKSFKFLSIWIFKIKKFKYIHRKKSEQSYKLSVKVLSYTTPSRLFVRPICLSVYLSQIVNLLRQVCIMAQIPITSIFYLLKLTTENYDHNITPWHISVVFFKVSSIFTKINSSTSNIDDSNSN